MMRSGTARRGARARLLVQEGLALPESRASSLPQEERAAAGGDLARGSELARDSRQQAASHKASSQPAAARAAARHLWLAVHLPALAIECLKLEKSFTNTSQDIELPKVIVSGEGAQCEVVAADATALALGIRPGHGLNAAYALAPQLGVLPRQPQREQLALERLARLQAAGAGERDRTPALMFLPGPFLRRRCAARNADSSGEMHCRLYCSPFSRLYSGARIPLERWTMASAPAKRQ